MSIPFSVDTGDATSSWMLMIIDRTFRVEWACHIYSPTGMTGLNDERVGNMMGALSMSCRFQIKRFSSVSTVDVTPDDGGGDGAFVSAVMRCYFTAEERSEWDSNQIRAELLALVARNIDVQEPRMGQHEEDFGLQIQRFPFVVTLYHPRGLSLISGYGAEQQGCEPPKESDVDTPVRCLIRTEASG